jgi:hypothetical protein
LVNLVPQKSARLLVLLRYANVGNSLVTQDLMPEPVLDLGKT